MDRAATDPRMPSRSSRRGSWRRCTLGILLAVAGLALSSLLVLQYGNPQWHRYIYLWQDLCPEGCNRPPGYSGMWTSWFLDGERRETWFRAGVPQGTDVYWYANGLPAFRAEVVDGVQQGPFTAWHDNGRLSLACWYDDGAMNGPVISWHTNGRIKEISWRERWKREGRQRSWNTEGVLMADGTWAHDQPWEGTFLERSSGRLRIVRYSNGVAVGAHGVGSQAEPLEHLDSSEP